LVLADRQRHDEGRSFSECASSSDLPSVAFNDLPANGQSHSYPGIFIPSMEALKRLKDLFQILLIEPDSIILN
jgi:hypothetical protein